MYCKSLIASSKFSNTCVFFKISSAFAEVLKETKKYKIKHPFFEIASANYKIIQIHKNLDSYLNTDKITEENSNPQK